MAEPIRQEVVLPATPGRIYSAYMDSAEHEAFTNNGPASISDDVGGAFSCHGGAISGRNVELVAGKRIVQAWRVATASNQPQRRGRPVVAPNSRPMACSMSAISAFSVGSGPSPTRVV